MKEKEIVWEGKFLNMVIRDGWEYTERKGITGIVGIIPITDDGSVVLVEQYRPPVDKQVIELPAGLVGDTDDAPDEDLESGARRELLEETGYEAKTMTHLFTGVSSAGISDEEVTFLLAKGVRKVAEGGGDGCESIIVHEVPVGELVSWLGQQIESGKVVDMKVYSALQFCG